MNHQEQTLRNRRNDHTEYEDELEGNDEVVDESEDYYDEEEDEEEESEHDAEVRRAWGM